ncbi:threonine--tRNA ligase [Caldisericum sp.]|uniref:Threonine--tRNA ligase n=1 Tax=Caldisericum exile TaxID=693075 RepID=A0A2J6WE81_9BACT|nr:MAG: threonine--tRNA ligase [Caldisericum exile]
MKIKISGKIYEFQEGLTIEEIFKQINFDISKIVAAKVNGVEKDLKTKINEDVEIEPIFIDTEEGEEILRHSTSHILAQAVMHLFPNAKYTIGPAIEKGFYYDFDLENPLTEEDLTKIEEEMKRIIDEKIPFERLELPKEKAIELFVKLNQPYKIEIIEEVKEDTVSIYRQGDFTDLCRGPHIPDTSYAKHFKLLNVAGAYWRGDEKNKMLQRVYGTAFATEERLKEYLNFLEEAKKRDHRKIGKELDLFSIQEEIGPGLILWHPKGATVRKIIEDFWRDEHIKRGYYFVYTPHIARVELWKTSGHWDFYRENMFSPMEVDKGSYMVKPMNCPFHIAIYKSRTRSYRDLPLRFAELGTVYRYERAGVLHGLLRVRGFTQDDAHLFVQPEKLEEEIIGVVEFAKYMIETFGFKNYNVYLSTRPEKYVGSLENWELATNALKVALDELKIPYKIDPGEGVFYGPKIDIKLVDAIGREWQGPTIQVDFNLPERFDVTYIGEDGKEHRPIMIHRVVLGSMERFFGTLIEQYAGAFPTWIAPIQVRIVPIADRHLEYAQSVRGRLFLNGLRVEVDERSEKMNAKIRDAETEKIPYILIVGDKEVSSGSVSVRKRRSGDIGIMSVDAFLERILNEVKNRVID